MNPFAWWLLGPLTWTCATLRVWALWIDSWWDIWQPLEMRFTAEELARLRELRERVQAERVEW